MKYDIFISYSRRDFDEVLALKQKLETEIPGLMCWFDIDGIESGDEFEDKIIKAINNSSHVLFALSDNSIKSQWTKDEVMYAKNIGKKIIPVLLAGAELTGWFLFKFGRIDCIDSTNPRQMEKLISNLSTWCGKEKKSEEPAKPATFFEKIKNLVTRYKLLPRVLFTPLLFWSFEGCIIFWFIGALYAFKSMKLLPFIKWAVIITIISFLFAMFHVD